MWSYLKSCLRRHRRKIFVLGGVIGGVALLNTYLKKKLVEWETQRASELCDQFKRSHHFEGTIAACDSALISFAPKIKVIVCNTVDVNPIVDQLKQNPPNKMQLWEQLKILVFTQVIGEMYAQCLLVVLLRVQMSILGGYVFATSQTSNAATSSVLEQQKYMSRITNFLENGINSLLIPIQKAVEEVLLSVPLNKPLNLQDVADIITSVRRAVSQGSASALPNVSFYVMSPNSLNGSSCNDEFLEKISIETRDILECRDFDQVLCSSIDQGINSLMDKLSECFGFLNDSKGEFLNPHDFRAPLAKIIPMMHNVFSQHQSTEPSALVHLLLQQESLKTFAANIYESFSQIKT